MKVRFRTGGLASGKPGGFVVAEREDGATAHLFFSPADSVARIALGLRRAVLAQGEPTEVAKFNMRTRTTAGWTRPVRGAAR